MTFSDDKISHLKSNNDTITLRRKANKEKSCPRVITKNILHDDCSTFVLNRVYIS